MVLGNAVGSTIAMLTVNALKNDPDWRRGKGFANYPGEDVSGIVAGETYKAITWDSKPNLSGGWFDTGWSCAQWKVWHQRLKEHFGKAQADEYWMNAWNAQGAYDWNNTNCRFDKDFRAYFKAEAIKSVYSDWFSNLFVGIDDLTETTADAVNETVSNLGDGLGSIAKYLPWILGGAALLFLFFYLKPFFAK